MHEVRPTVLLAANLITKQDVIGKIYSAYRRCYSEQDSWLITDSMAKPLEEMEKFIRRMLKAEHAHESPLEHASLTFHITCSRVCSHQLVRHRIASYSQQSQRYVKVNDLPFIIPPKIAADANQKAIFVDTMKAVEEAYVAMTDICDAAAEDARFVLPNATATHIIVTMNFRTLRHFFSERCCNRAQWEIKMIADQMLDICKTLYPCIFEDCGPHCKRIKHCPEHRPCGKQPWKE